MKANRVGFGLVAALVACMAFASTSAVASEPGSSESETQAMSLRQQMGLESDLEHVRVVADDPDANNSELGIPLAADEVTALQARRVLGKSTNTVSAALEKFPTFAGAWFLQEGTGVIAVSFVGAVPAAAITILDATLPNRTSYRLESARNTLTELTKLYSTISNDPSFQGTPGALHDVALVKQDNVVTVGVDSTATSDRLYNTYGTSALKVSVTTTPSPSSRNFTSGPLYGGEWLSFANGEECSNGYGNVTSQTDKLYTITAGHCAPQNTDGSQGQGQITAINEVHGQHTFNGKSTNCDCLLLGVISAAKSSKLVYVTNNNTYYYTNNSGPYDGEASCHTGAKSYEVNGSKIECGTILTVNSTATATDPGFSYTLTDAIKWSGHERLGDSGAPMGDGNSFLGLASIHQTIEGSIDSKYSWYSKIANINGYGWDVHY